jgi:hypothetical protein
MTGEAATRCFSMVLGRCGGGGTVPTPDRTAPTVTASPRAAATSCTQIQVNWNASTDSGGSGLKGYDVYRNGNMWTQVMAPSVAVIDGGRSASTTYSYQVAAFDTAGNRSARTGSVSAPTPACPTSTGPAVIGSVSGVGVASDVAVNPAGSFAFVASPSSGLKVVDVSVRNAPRIVGSLDLPGAESQVVLLPNGYVGVGQDDHVAVVDVRVPSSPKLALRVPVPGRPLALESAGSMLYVSSTDFSTSSAKLLAFDVQNPTVPRALGSMALDASAFDLAVKDGVVYLVSSADVRIADARNPGSMTKYPFTASGASAATIVQDLLVLHGASQRMLIYELPNPLSPRFSTNVGYGVKDIASQNRSGVAAAPTAELWLLDFAGLVGRGLIQQAPTPAKVQVPATVNALARLGSDVFAADSGGRLNVIRVGP